MRVNIRIIILSLTVFVIKAGFILPLVTSFMISTYNSMNMGLLLSRVFVILCFTTVYIQDNIIECYYNIYHYSSHTCAVARCRRCKEYDFLCIMGKINTAYILFFLGLRSQGDIYFHELENSHYNDKYCERIPLITNVLFN